MFAKGRFLFCCALLSALIMFSGCTSHSLALNQSITIKSLDFKELGTCVAGISLPSSFRSFEETEKGIFQYGGELAGEQVYVVGVLMPMLTGSSKETWVNDRKSFFEHLDVQKLTEFSTKTGLPVISYEEINDNGTLESHALIWLTDHWYMTLTGNVSSDVMRSIAQSVKLVSSQEV